VSEIFRVAAIAIHMLFAFGLIVLVLAHSGKDAGLSGAFGVGSSSFGSTQIMERNLTRFTIMCSLGLVCTTIILGFIL
jgi:preprotein translocase subunit SecG